MSFSYADHPLTSQTDEVRFLIHDTDEATALLSDEEIAYIIGRQASVYDDMLMAAALCAEIIAGRYAGEVSISSDGVSYSGDQLQQKYRGLAEALRTTYKSLSAVGGAPSAGGISRYEHPDRTVRPLSFGKGMHDNLWAGGQDWGNPATTPSYDRDDSATGTGGP